MQNGTSGKSGDAVSTPEDVATLSVTVNADSSAFKSAAIKVVITNQSTSKEKIEYVVLNETSNFNYGEGAYSISVDDTSELQSGYIMDSGLPVNVEIVKNARQDVVIDIDTALEGSEAYKTVTAKKIAKKILSISDGYYTQEQAEDIGEILYDVGCSGMTDYALTLGENGSLFSFHGKIKAGSLDSHQVNVVTQYKKTCDVYITNFQVMNMLTFTTKNVSFYLYNIDKGGYIGRYLPDEDKCVMYNDSSKMANIA